MLISVLWTAKPGLADLPERGACALNLVSAEHDGMLGIGSVSSVYHWCDRQQHSLLLQREHLSDRLGMAVGDVMTVGAVWRGLEEEM
jgi:hypothetical protein